MQHACARMHNVFDGDHDEADCPKRGWSRTMVHNTIVDALCRFLKDCGMDDVQAEVKYSSTGTLRVLGRMARDACLMLPALTRVPVWSM